MKNLERLRAASPVMRVIWVVSIICIIGFLWAALDHEPEWLRDLFWIVGAVCVVTFIVMERRRIGLRR